MFYFKDFIVFPQTYAHSKFGACKKSWDSSMFTTVLHLFFSF